MLDSQTVLQNYSEFVDKTFPDLAHSFLISTILFQNPLYVIEVLSINTINGRNVIFIRYSILGDTYTMSIRRYGIHFPTIRERKVNGLFSIEPYTTSQDFLNWYNSFDIPRLS